MDDSQKVNVLRVFFNSSVVKYGNKLIDLMGKEGYAKFQAETASGKSLVAGFGMKSAKDAFFFMKEINGIPWEKEGDTFVTKACPAMAVGKQMGLQPTCEGCCYVPMKAIVKALDTGLTIDMESSLWEDGKPCVFRVRETK